MFASTQLQIGDAVGQDVVTSCSTTVSRIHVLSRLKELKKRRKILLDNWFASVKKNLAKAAKPLWPSTVPYQQALLPRAIRNFWQRVPETLQQLVTGVGAKVFVCKRPKACDFNNCLFITGTAVRSKVSALMDERTASQTET